MVRVTFPSLTVGELSMLTFPFVLAVGETISTKSVAATVYSGTDPTPSNVISGSATSSGAVVSQKITGIGAVLGVIYDLVCTITTSAGQTLQCGGYLAIVPSGS